MFSVPHMISMLIWVSLFALRLFRRLRSSSATSVMVVGPSSLPISRAPIGGVAAEAAGSQGRSLRAEIPRPATAALRKKSLRDSLVAIDDLLDIG